MQLASIHVLLCEIRKENKLGQKDVAEALNVEQATISLYETGKRGIPLDLLDEWLRLLNIEIKITPKGRKPLKPEKDIKDSLGTFNGLKKKRNYLIAELRANTASKLLREPLFRETIEESGESRFWPYSLYGEENVGVIETRYDHPEQKYLAVEYTTNGVNVYKTPAPEREGEEQGNQSMLRVNRIYFSEDDFLSLGDAWEQEEMDAQRITILRRNMGLSDGVEVVHPEGFSARTLLQMQEIYLQYSSMIREIEAEEAYKQMEMELDIVNRDLLDIALNNRLENGALNPEFVFWTELDREAVDVPLWSPERNWSWKEEGVTWVEDHLDADEICVRDDSIPHEELYTHRDRGGNRIIGLAGDEKKPALFKSSVHRPNVVYRAVVEPEELNEDELNAYRTILEATRELDGIRQTTENPDK